MPAIPAIPVDPHLCHITSSLNIEAWRTCLSSHPDKAYARYILKGIVEGFHIGFDRTCSLKSAKGNMVSACDHAEVAEKYLKGEREAGRILGPFDSNELTPEAHTKSRQKRYLRIPRQNWR